MNKKGKKALIFTGLVSIDENLVGTAIIYKKIADIFLEEGYFVTMVVPEKNNFKIKKKLKFQKYDNNINKKLINLSDVIIFGAYPPSKEIIYSYQKKKIIVSYMWSIAPIGSLEFKDFSNKKDQICLHRFISSSYNLSLLLSDKIFCRDKKIKNLLLGSLVSLGRVNLENYQIDKQFKNLIEEAGFGVDSQKAKKNKKLYKGVINGINDDDFILLWNGGIWNWNDGETLIRAMNLLKNEKIKLVFQGFKHPSLNVKLSAEAKKSLKLSADLGLKDCNIFFLDDWIPYNERADYLLEADMGIVSSPDIPEANLFLKTRIYDYLWAGLPVILNDCEAFSDIVRSRKMGLVLKNGDYYMWAKSIKALKENRKDINRFKLNIKEYSKEINWKKTLKPIKKFAQKPIKLSDNRDKKNKLIQDNISLNENIIYEKDKNNIKK